MIVAVTAFVPIPGHPRSEDEYHQLAMPLRDLPIISATEDLENCWLYRYIEEVYGSSPNLTYSVSDNPRKNSLAYHIVQAQKTEFLVDAAKACALQPDVYVWIDYGIMHVPGVTAKIIDEFLKRADGEQAIAIPGCWGPDYKYDDGHPCWRFCGGVMVVPRQYLADFNHEMKREYVCWIRQSNNVSWEVNTLARLERRGLELPLWWYQADHNETIFTNYRATEYADGRLASGSRAGEATFAG